MSLRDAMRDSAIPFLEPGEQVQAVFGAQTASQYIAGLAGIFVFLGLNRYRIFAIPVGAETLRVHRRFYKDIETADQAITARA